MRHRVKVILVYGVLGLLLSVTVAWGGVVLRHVSPRAAVGSVVHLLAVWTTDMTYEPTGPEPWDHVKLTTAGWPLRCLEQRVERVPTYSQVFAWRPVSGALVGGIRLKDVNARWRDVDFLPVRPRLVALALDPIAWGLIAFLLFGLLRTPGAIRARLRTRRNRCGACGYSLKKLTSDRCPECGHDRRGGPRSVAPPIWWPVVLSAFLLVTLVMTAMIHVTGERFQPIHFAAATGNIELLARELADGVDPDLPCEILQRRGIGPIHLAIERDQTTVVAMLLEAGADPNAAFFGGNALHLAIEEDNRPIVELLIAHGADINSFDTRGSTPLLHAIHLENEALAAHLLDAGADPNLRLPGLPTPLNRAAWNRWPVLGRHLLHVGADATIGSPLSPAASAETLELANMLFDAGARPTATELHHAAGSGRVANIQWVLDHADDPESLVQPGETLLHRLVATKRHHRREVDREAVELLLEIGAQLDVPDSQGDSVLTKAIGLLRPEIIELMLDAGANPDGIETNRYPPLVLAALYDHESGRLLIEHGADINIALRELEQGQAFRRSPRIDSALEFLREASIGQQ